MKNNFEQLSFFDVVLKPPETLLVENKFELPLTTATTERHTGNICPYVVPSIAEIIKLTDRACISHDKDGVISDLFCCMAISISNLVDLYQKPEREERYRQIISHYTKQEQDAMSKICGKLFMLLSSVVYDDGVFSDYLGELFMQCFMGNKHMGQFFTPYHISKLCAKIAIGEPPKNKIITLHEPCCGSGGMVLAAMDVLKNDFGINYAMDLFCGLLGY